MENSTEKVCIRPHRSSKSLENGVRANALGGSCVIICNDLLSLKFIIINILFLWEPHAAITSQKISKP